MNTSIFRGDYPGTRLHLLDERKHQPLAQLLMFIFRGRNPGSEIRGQITVFANILQHIALQWGQSPES